MFYSNNIRSIQAKFGKRGPTSLPVDLDPARLRIWIWLLACFVPACGCSGPGNTAPAQLLLSRAPLNFDPVLLGISDFGVVRTHILCVSLLNFGILAGILYLIAKEEADFSAFVYLYIGITAGGFLLSLALNRFIGAASIIPIISLGTLILVRFGQLSAKRAIWVSIVFHAYQLAYICVFRAIMARVT